VSLEEFVKRGQAAQAAVDAALKPKSGAGLWRYENSGHVRCVLCDKVITDRPLPMASHARSHVRKGEATESGNYGSREWRVK
jgi:hypothetical protein